jgi:cytochrome c oxidase assembly protein subunit 15
MFLFPISQWVGGIFYEHTHRLAASLVGLLTTLLAVWLWLKESRAWVRWLGVIAFFGVVFQGIGRLQVTLYRIRSAFSTPLAQMFLVLSRDCTGDPPVADPTRRAALRISHGLRQMFG